MKKDWKIVKIPDVLFFQEGPGVRKSQFTTDGVKLLNVGNINGGQINLSKTKMYISENEAFGKYKHFLVDEGDLVIASSGIVVDNFHNKIAFIKKEHLPLCMNTSTIRFKVIDNRIIDINYFKFFLKTRFFSDQLQKLITGSAQLNFGPSHLSKIDLLLPPIEDQNKILTILNQADSLRQKRKQSYHLLDEYLESVFFEMFGDPVLNKKDWNVESLGKIAKLERGRFSPRPRNDPSYFGGIYPFIQTGDISRSKHRLKKYTQTLNEKGIKVSKQFFKEDIVIAIVGATIGATSILEIDAYATDSIICIKPVKDVINNIFLEYVMRFWRKPLLMNAPEAARPNINLVILSKLLIVLPPMELQVKFAKLLEQVEMLKKRILSQSEELDNHFDSLMQESFNTSL